MDVTVPTRNSLASAARKTLMIKQTPYFIIHILKEMVYGTVPILCIVAWMFHNGNIITIPGFVTNMQQGGLSPRFIQHIASVAQDYQDGIFSGTSVTSDTRRVGGTRQTGRSVSNESGD
jgi:hypothetical protein